MTGTPAVTGPDRAGAELLAGLRARNPAVAGPLWQRFAPTIFRILRRTLGPDARVDDAAQVVILCVFERARRLRSRADLSQLVLKVTARIAHGELRRRAFSWLFAPFRAHAGGKGAVGDDPVPEDVARFYRILDRLRALDRVAFVLRYIEGLDAREVAAAIGDSPARLGRRLRRSVDKVVAGIDGDPRLAALTSRAAPR